MKFKNTTSSALADLPTEDSIVVTTDTSLIGYCANNALYKVDKPVWREINEPGIWLIRDGVLNTKLAEQHGFRQFYSSSARVYQGEDGYILQNINSYGHTCYRFTIDFTDLATIDIAATATNNRATYLIVTDQASVYDSFGPGLASGKVAGTSSIDVGKITGTHFLYVYLTYVQTSTISTTTSLVLS